eukprot:CCRYP_017052-RA/>CCRYP_017052-RA protein AED:0.13 eAED:0.13 QI:0/0/0/1/0.66/0.5/4/0/396
MNKGKEVDIVSGTKAFAIEIADREDESKTTAVIYSAIPRGLAVVDHHTFKGKKIVATKAFKEGEELYVGHAALVDLSAANNAYTLRLYSENCDITNDNSIGVSSQKYVLVDEFQNSTVHSVLETGDVTKRQVRKKFQVYGFDGYMNHSCDANTIHPLICRTHDEISYKAIALRDIEVGEEITCDYALFDWACDGHEIELCLCGSKNCRGRMFGFESLGLKEKIELLPFVEDEIKEKFISGANFTVVTSSLPNGIDIQKIKNGNFSEHHLVATKKYEVGEVVFSNQAVILPRDDDTTFVLNVDEKYFLLNRDHFIHREHYMEMVGFDSFMDHSCDPNCKMTYTQRDIYEMSATKTISAGEKITCNYMQMECLGMRTAGIESFECSCGEPNCVGIIIC